MSKRRFLQRICLEGFLFFPQFQKSSKNFSEFWREIFGRVVTTTFIHVHRNISRKVIFLSKSSKFFFVVFGIWAAIVWTLRENYLLPLSRLHSPLLKNHFCWKTYICSKNCNFNILGVRKSFSFFGNKVTEGLPKFHCACSDEHLGRNYFVWKAHKFFILSGSRAKSFQCFDDKFFTGWSQMDSTCAEAQFEEK